MSLSATQRKHLERRLLDERSRALRTLGRSVAESADGDEQDRSGDLTSMPLHMADLGTDTMQQELDASNATRVSRELGITREAQDAWAAARTRAKTSRLRAWI